LLEQQADGGGGQRRGCGADPEPRARLDLHALLEIRPAKAFGPDDLAAGRDRHRQPRQVSRDQMRARDLLRLLDGAGPPRRRRRLPHRRDIPGVRVQRF
jgi:hypothetical protein